jgi:hypothetical protein
MMPYQLVYGKTCHLPVELEHKSLQAIKKWNIMWWYAVPRPLLHRVSLGK